MSTTRIHYVSVNDGGTQQGNYGNDGATGTNSMALGVNATSAGAGAVAVGYGANAASTSAIAIGQNATANGNQATAIGLNAVASSESSMAMGAGATAGAPNSVALGAGSVASQANTVSIGTPGNERRITNVAPGVNPTDAVNVSQLEGLQQNINQVARNAYSGIAMAGALAGLPQVEQNKTFALSAGIGGYGGYTALAIGASARITANTIVKAGVSAADSGPVLFNVGVGYSW
jgi:autotransporter adhesin